MAKIRDYQLGDLKGTLYKYGDGYTYKIRYNKNIVARQYTYMYSKEDCFNKMKQEMQYLLDIQSTLLDFDKL